METDTTYKGKRQNLGPMGMGAHTMTRAEYYARSEGRESPLDHSGRSRKTGKIRQAD